MEYTYENERTLRIRLTFDDLREHEIKLVDFISEQELIETLYSELIDELDLGDRWENMETMAFQVRPHANGIDLLVSEDEAGLMEVPENGTFEELESFIHSISENQGELPTPLKMLEEITQSFSEVEKERNTKNEKKEESPEEKPPVPDFIYYALQFRDFETILSLASTIDLPLDESELYEYKGDFYLTVLDNQKEKGEQATLGLRALMLEYATQSAYTREHLREYAHVILDHDALRILKTI
ncbi:MAG: adaptor protein MecA [Streptococcaceae bacterium]|jgi:adapter protein MecA 1/2|nr:adaptor protein MecA [Streptococcaceae bacterium]